jgi:hypothetical protein
MKAFVESHALLENIKTQTQTHVIIAMEIVALAQDRIIPSAQRVIPDILSLKQLAVLHVHRISLETRIIFVSIATQLV